MLDLLVPCFHEDRRSLNPCAMLWPGTDKHMEPACVLENLFAGGDLSAAKRLKFQQQLRKMRALP